MKNVLRLFSSVPTTTTLPCAHIIMTDKNTQAKSPALCFYYNSNSVAVRECIPSQNKSNVVLQSQADNEDTQQKQRQDIHGIVFDVCCEAWQVHHRTTSLCGGALLRHALADWITFQSDGRNIDFATSTWFSGRNETPTQPRTRSGYSCCVERMDRRTTNQSRGDNSAGSFKYSVRCQGMRDKMTNIVFVFCKKK